MSARNYSKAEKLNIVYEFMTTAESLAEFRRRHDLSTIFHQWRKAFKEEGCLTDERLQGWIESDDKPLYCLILVGDFRPNAFDRTLEEKKELLREYFTGLASTREWAAKHDLRVYHTVQWKNELLAKGAITHQQLDQWKDIALEKRRNDPTSVVRRIRVGKPRKFNKEQKLQILREHLTGRLSRKDVQRIYGLTETQCHHLVIYFRKRGEVTDEMVAQWRQEALAHNNTSESYDPHLMGKMGRHNRLTMEQRVDIIIKCLISGKQIKEIAYDAGISHTYATRILQRYKDSATIKARLQSLADQGVDVSIKLRIQERPTEVLYAAVKEYQIRETKAADIALKYGVSKHTIKAWTVQLLAEKIISHNDILVWRSLRRRHVKKIDIDGQDDNQPKASESA